MVGVMDSQSHGMDSDQGMTDRMVIGMSGEIERGMSDKMVRGMSGGINVEKSDGMSWVMPRGMPHPMGDMERGMS